MYRWKRNPDSDGLPMTPWLRPEVFEEQYERARDAALQFELDHANGALAKPGRTAGQRD